MSLTTRLPAPLVNSPSEGKPSWTLNFEILSYMIDLFTSTPNDERKRPTNTRIAHNAGVEEVPPSPALANVLRPQATTLRTVGPDA
jgi:hypothetical protein